MLPPVDATVLSNNPKFHALYDDLCTGKLNPDGTSKILDAKVLKEREVFAEVCFISLALFCSMEKILSGWAQDFKTRDRPKASYVATLLTLSLRPRTSERHESRLREERSLFSG